LKGKNKARLFQRAVDNRKDCSNLHFNNIEQYNISQYNSDAFLNEAIVI